MLFWAVVTGLALVGGAWVLRNLLSATVALYLRLQERSAKCRPWASVLLLVLTAICFMPMPLLGLGRFGFLRQVYIGIRYLDNRDFRMLTDKEGANTSIFRS